MAFRSHPDIMGAWPSLVAFARDVSEKYDTIKGWHRRRQIPSECWLIVIEQAKARGIAGIDLQTMERTQRISARRLHRIRHLRRALRQEARP